MSEKYVVSSTAEKADPHEFDQFWLNGAGRELPRWCVPLHGKAAPTDWGGAQFKSFRFREKQSDLGRIYYKMTIF